MPTQAQRVQLTALTQLSHRRITRKISSFDIVVLYKSIEVKQMAESGLVKDLHDNFLQCAICMEGYKSPRMLPCIHSFCLKCLEKLAQSLQNKPFSCPTCRAAVTIPKTGLKDLPSNFLLVNLMERFNLADTTGSTSSSKCHFCNGIKNIERCIDCDMYVCVTCKQVHDKIPDCHDHKVIPIDKLSDEKYIKGILAFEVPRCSEHQKEKLRFYCTTCSKLVCRDCAIVGHRGHECLEPNARVTIAKQNLERAIENSGKAVISVQQMSANVIAATTSIEQEIANSEQKVDQQYDQVIERLKADRNNLREVLEKIKTQQCTQLKEMKDGVTNWTEAMKNTQVVAKKIMAAENQWDILGMEKDITDAFKKLHDDEIALSNKRFMVQEVSNTTITFSPSVMSASQIATPVTRSQQGFYYGNAILINPPKPVCKNLLGTVKQSFRNTDNWFPKNSFEVQWNMAESGLVKDLHDNFLQCAICMEGYKSPRMLPCIHSFCLNCLEKLAQSLQNKPFSCPTCRAAVTIPRTGLKDLPSNFLLVSLMERFNLADTTGSTSSSYCHFCYRIQNTQRCIDCDIYVCVTCRQFHDRVPGCSDHQVIPVEKFADETYIKSVLAFQVPRCIEHRKEKLRFYCSPCRKLVCRDCAIVSHRGHECIEAEKRVGAVKQEFYTALQSSQHLIESIQQTSGYVAASSAKVEKYISECIQQIDQEYLSMSNKLQSDRYTLLQQLENIKQQQSIPLKDVQDGVTNWKKGMKNTQVVTTKILAGNNQWDILGMEKDLIAAFKKLCDDERSLKSKRSRIENESIAGVTFDRTQRSSYHGHNGNLLGTINLLPNANRHSPFILGPPIHNFTNLTQGSNYQLQNSRPSQSTVERLARLHNQRR
ncbi:uncharacterized protein [Apostichopus japonicus]|uniref:uncharacterized protein n=1 Tax=Stichopus japonicus TaxID=307972 RepID=UPI003AB909A9